LPRQHYEENGLRNDGGDPERDGLVAGGVYERLPVALLLQLIGVVN